MLVALCFCFYGNTDSNLRFDLFSLVTHHLDVLPHADHIILMDGGRIVEQGTYAVGACLLISLIPPNPYHFIFSSTVGPITHWSRL